jgi:hypothetical protein
MPDQQLIELAIHIEDLVPDAKTALAAELQKRGIQPSDIVPAAAPGTKPPDQPEKTEVPADDEAEPGHSHMETGPTPPDWIKIPQFSLEESLAVTECMEQNHIPFKILPQPGCCRQQCTLAVPKEMFPNCINALKECFGLTDDQA